MKRCEELEAQAAAKKTEEAAKAAS
jgi:hypothetical protein